MNVVTEIEDYNNNISHKYYTDEYNALGFKTILKIESTKHHSVVSMKQRRILPNGDKASAEESLNATVESRKEALLRNC